MMTAMTMFMKIMMIKRDDLNKSATLTRVTTVRTMERERGMAVAIGKRLTACRMMSILYGLGPITDYSL